MYLKYSFRTISLLFLIAISGFATTVSPSISETPCANAAAGLCTGRADAYQINFDLATASSSYADGMAIFTFAPGTLSPFLEGSAGGEYAAPPNDETRYLSIGSPSRAGSVIVDFLMPITYYGLYLSSPDVYNSFTFFETGNNVTPIASFTGANLIPPADGNQLLAKYIDFSITGGTVSRIVLSSSQPALESDNHAYVLALAHDPLEAPEPATMILMGSALVGIALFNRRRNSNR
jgi:hypothetical protein